MHTTKWIGRLMATTWDTYPLINMGTIVLWLTISYIQQTNHMWIEGDKEETTY
jgi:hypothetical protein